MALCRVLLFCFFILYLCSTTHGARIHIPFEEAENTTSACIDCINTADHGYCVGTVSIK